MAASLLASASFAFLHTPTLIRPAAAQPLRPALFPRLAQPAALLLPEQLPSALVADSLLDSVGGVAAAGVGAVLLIALLAGKGNMASGAALMVLFLGGDPDERDASGANENKLLKEFALSITPSAWKKAYQGEGAEDGEPAALLALPAWQGEEARELTEPEARAASETPPASLSPTAAHSARSTAARPARPPTRLRHVRRRRSPACSRCSSRRSPCRRSGRSRPAT